MRRWEDTLAEAATAGPWASCPRVGPTVSRPSISESNPTEREWQPSELARRAEIGRFGHERDDVHGITLQQAFDGDPLFRWVYGDRSPAEQQRFWQLVLAGSRRGTEVHAAQTSDVVAVWVPPVGSIPQPASTTNGGAAADVAAAGLSTRDRIAEALGPRAPEIFGYFAAMQKARPETPHWYLQAIGTRPAQQGHGWGARALAPILARCDRTGLPACLESSNPQNHAFYHRLGFVDVGEITVPAAPSMMRMQRPARDPGE